MTLQLWYDETCLGRIDGAFEHQGTWFGDFHAGDLCPTDAQHQRLGEFIDFCRGWYAREGSPAGADVNEFAAFDDIVRSGLWYTIDEHAWKATIADAPMFMDGRHGEISWVVRNAGADAPRAHRC